MSKVIKHGDKRKYCFIETCNLCGCIFEYDNHDFLPSFHYSLNEDQVKCEQKIQCPDCYNIFKPTFHDVEEKDEIITILPKVMTETEVISWINSDPNTRNPIYEECRGNVIGEWIDPFDDYNTSDIVGYGIAVRCWTFKPSNELMLKTEWDV